MNTQHLLLHMLVLLMLPLASQADVYKCLVNGKVIYTDQECPDSQDTEFTMPSLNTTGATEVNYTGSIWFRDSRGYALAMEAGEKENLPVLIYAYTDWCGFCKRLEKDYFAHPEVNKNLVKLIKVKLNPEHSVSDKKLFESLGGSGYPTLYIQHPHQPLQRLSDPFVKMPNGQRANMSQKMFNKQFRQHLMAYEKVVEAKKDAPAP